MEYCPSSPQVLMSSALDTLDDVMLGVGMGLGKTAPCLHQIAKMLMEKRIRGAVVVGPPRVVNITWPDEQETWDQCRWMKMVSLRTDEGCEAFMRGAAHIYTINYQSLHKLCALVEAYRKQVSKVLPFNLVVFDEITMAKNPAAKRIKQYRRTVGRVKHQWGLTGTLQPNNLMDVFAQYRLLDGGKRLGSLITDFRSNYFTVSEYNRFDIQPKPGAQDTIARIVSDMTVLLPSSEWSDIPQPYLEDIDIAWPKALWKDYQTLEKKMVHNLLNGDVITVPSMGALVNKLLQFTAGALYDDKKVAHHIHRLKMDALKKAVKDSDGPVLIARGFTFERAMLTEEFPSVVFFEEAKSQEAQRALLRQWNAKKIPLMAAHPASVGHGLNMQHGGHEIIWLTQTWNRDQVDQMNCRLARRGQKQKVRIRRLMMEDSIDYTVASSNDSKRDEEESLFQCLKLLTSAKDTDLSIL